ncbi:MAG: tRNA ((37)-N6)-threonylcarbamoyltransferase complex dimerization subunit type 1 TsaB [Pseudomonadota bacterium]
MSIAVGVGLGTQQARQWSHTGVGGAQTSHHLLPEIQALMAQAGLRFDDLDAIAFGAGPGSFTGLRTACAVAQGLGFAAGKPLLAVDSLLALAEEARALAGAPQAMRVLALLDARMDEMYAGNYEFNSNKWTPTVPKRLVRPENLGDTGGWTLAGNVFAAYGPRLPALAVPTVQAGPTASAMLRLAPALMAAGGAVSAAQALPLYIRDKVAQTTDERAAQRLAAATP